METAKWVTLNTDDSQISEVEIHEVGKGSVKTSKIEWRQLICARKGWEMQMREKVLSIGWDECG